MAGLNACILIKTVPIETQRVLEKARKLEGVRKVFVAYGRFDLVVFVSGADYPAIRRITGALNSIDGVRSTESLVEA